MRLERASCITLWIATTGASQRNGELGGKSCSDARDFIKSSAFLMALDYLEKLIFWITPIHDMDCSLCRPGFSACSNRPLLAVTRAF
ncbi:hypothetical protein REMIM1_PE00124 (plasmid) [Rhizobium etli bv. mimosae str. Mim1]|nr:hypothetical protein REMIM1_PE00124 [Rhizobium etli bv. mimosae str. Mim1]